MNVIVTVVVALVMFVIAALSGRAIPHAVREAHPWLAQIVVKIVLTIESFALMYASKKPLATYGFRKSEGRNGKLIALAFGLGALATLVVLGAGLKGLAPILKGYTFLDIVIGAWIISSVAEEIFVRGWFQSTIAGQVSRRAEILLSGALFGSMHASLFFAGVEPASAVVIMVSTFCLGLVTATLRARSGSLMPAIYAHVAFNVGGMFGGVIGVIAKKVAAKRAAG